jgi:hypothetical protein
MQIANLKYADPTSTLIDLDVTLDEATANEYHAAGETIPYTYHPGDTWPVNVAIGELLAQGGYTIAPYVAPPAPVPARVSDRQFFQQLAIEGAITQAQALAAVKTGEMPPALLAIINAMPQADQFNALMLLSGATTFERAHPMTAAIAAATGRTVEQTDDFFRAAALL